MGDCSSSAPRSLHVFQLFLRQYAYCQEHDRFEAVPPVPAQLPTLLLQALDKLQAINKGVYHSLSFGGFIEVTPICSVLLFWAALMHRFHDQF